MRTEQPRYVLDSFALLAYLAGEPGGPPTEVVLREAAADITRVFMCIVNYGEVVYITERERGARLAAAMIAAVDQLPIMMVDADRELSMAAAHIKANHAVSYADAYAIALAEQVGGRLLTGDPEFRSVEHLVSVQWLPRA